MKHIVGEIILIIGVIVVAGLSFWFGTVSERIRFSEVLREYTGCKVQVIEENNMSDVLHHIGDGVKFLIDYKD